MATRGARIAVVGATGALGTEVLTALDATHLPIGQLVAVAGEASLGCNIEFQDEIVPVETELPGLQGLDLVICCAPPAVALEVARAALRAEVPCIDASGAFVSRAEVPLLWASGGDLVGPAPLLASPVDAALAWLPWLRALSGDAAPSAVQATVLESASSLGRRGIDALTAESLALFNQQELPEPVPGTAPLAFDLYPRGGEREAALRESLGRLLPAAPLVSAFWVQTPVFVGQASSLRVVWERPVEAARVADQLAKARGVELWSGEGDGPNLRAVSGRDVVLVGPPRPDPTDPTALHLFLVADVLRLAAGNVAALAAATLEARGVPGDRDLH
jgi:aspartate-semialdehyde dehydrogenase